LSKDKRPSTKASIIIPTYNEVENVGELINALAKVASSARIDMEVIIVDDGSTDGTMNIIEGLRGRYGNLKVLLRPGKMGLGSAYRDGMGLAQGEIVIQMDADLSHRPEDIPRLLRALSEADLAIGSRYVPGGCVVGWSPLRLMISRVANLLARFLLRLGIKDATSGFRAWRKEAFMACANASRCCGYDFQVEMAFLARELGLRIKEIPITFVGRRKGDSKLTPLDILSFLKSILSMVGRGRGGRPSPSHEKANKEDLLGRIGHAEGVQV